MKRLGRVGHCLSLMAGACLGSFAFLVFAVLVSAKPIREAVLSARGILVSSKPLQLTAEQSATIAGLLEKGDFVERSADKCQFLLLDDDPSADSHLLCLWNVELFCHPGKRQAAGVNINHFRVAAALDPI